MTKWALSQGCKESVRNLQYSQINQCDTPQ